MCLFSKADEADLDKAEQCMYLQYWSPLHQKQTRGIESQWAVAELSHHWDYKTLWLMERGALEKKTEGG